MTVKVNTHHQHTVHIGAVGDPNMLDGALTLDVCQGQLLAGMDDQVGVDLPALAQLTGSLRGAALNGHAALALFTGEIFGRNGEGADAPFFDGQIR